MPPSPSSSDDAQGNGGRRRQWQWARSADWDVHRARITELYRDRGLHLDQVINIMASEHGFYASPRMYKTRISKWAIDKNYKAADVACMLLLKRQRAAQGKASSFILRGRKVDWAKIEQYLKRDSTLLRRLEAGDDLLDLVPGRAQTSCIICRTPSPPPMPCSSAMLPSHTPMVPPMGPSMPSLSSSMSSLLSSTPVSSWSSSTSSGLSYYGCPATPAMPASMLDVQQHQNSLYHPPGRHSIGSVVSNSALPPPLHRLPTLLHHHSADSLQTSYHHQLSLPPPMSTMSTMPAMPAMNAAMPAAPSVPRLLAPPPETSLPEELARLTRDYCLGALDKGLWVQDASVSATGGSNYVSVFGGQDGADRLRLWGQRIRLGRHLIGLGHLDEGFRRVGHCMDELRQHMQEEDPALLFHLLGNTFGHTANFRSLATTLCGHIRELAHIVLGAHHPLARLFGRLTAIVTSDIHFSLLPLPLQCMADVLQARDGGRLTPAVMALEADPLCERFAMLLLGSKQPPRVSVAPRSASSGSLGASAGITSLSSPPSSPATLQQQQQCSPRRNSISAAGPAASSVTASADASGSHRPAIGFHAPETQAELQHLFGVLETSRNVHVRTRFYHGYLTYLSRVALAASAPGCAGMADMDPLTGSSLAMTSSQIAMATSAAIAEAVATSAQTAARGGHPPSVGALPPLPSSSFESETGLLTVRDMQHFYILNVDVAPSTAVSMPPLPTAVAGPLSSPVTPGPVPTMLSAVSAPAATPRTLVSISSRDMMCGSLDNGCPNYDMSGLPTGEEPSMSRELEDLVDVKWVLP